MAKGMMVVEALWSVFDNAAALQKIVLILLYAALPGTLVAAAMAARAPGDGWRRVVAEMRIIGPTFGLLVGGLNSFHMGRTIQKLPFEPTLKQVAPGIFEVSTFVGLGALVGLVAVAAHIVISIKASGERTF